MKIDFWQCTNGPVERVVVQIAERVCAAGDRLLVVDGDAARRARISDALWAHAPERFLANGDAAAPHAARQPILLADAFTAANGAQVAVLADGEWRDVGEGLARVILLFGEEQVVAARQVWRQLDGRDDLQRGYFAQEDGKWVKRL